MEHNNKIYTHISVLFQRFLRWSRTTLSPKLANELDRMDKGIEEAFDHIDINAEGVKDATDRLDELEPRVAVVEVDSQQALYDAFFAQEDATNAWREAEIAQATADSAHERIDGLSDQLSDADDAIVLAQTTAEDAQLAADAAQQAAENAQTTADDAKSAAEDARTKANDAEILSRNAVKSVNGILPDARGNVEVSGGGSSAAMVWQPIYPIIQVTAKPISYFMYLQDSSDPTKVSEFSTPIELVHGTNMDVWTTERGDSDGRYGIGMSNSNNVLSEYCKFAITTSIELLEDFTPVQIRHLQEAGAVDSLEAGKQYIMFAVKGDATYYATEIESEMSTDITQAALVTVDYFMVELYTGTDAELTPVEGQPNVIYQDSVTGKYYMYDQGSNGFWPYNINS